MAKRMAQNSLSGKLGNAGQQAFENHKNDETTLAGGGELPAGIENGIAQLRDIKLGVYKDGKNKGEFYFMANATVQEPKEVDGIPIDGLYTQIGPEPLCDTPESQGKRKTVDDRIAWMLNELRKLGVDSSTVDSANIDSWLDAAFEGLKETKPYFRFRTWKGQATPQFPNPRVNHVWNGLVNYQAEEIEDVDDSSGDDGAEQVEEAEEPQNATVNNATVDLDDLASVADADDGSEECAAAQQQLYALAKEQGIDPDNYEKWAEVANLLNEAGGGSDKITPKEGEVYGYIPDGKRKAIEVEVKAVFDGKETANLKSLEDGTLYRSQAWSRLSRL